ncbi:flavonol sulfotransferase-like protein, partial [Trifolium medium]|nr:flavonol sulfotransferase-like protein [Trifolium medium]
GRSSGGRGKGNKLCTHCGQTNHIIDNCWKKYGYPPHLQYLQKNDNGNINNCVNASDDAEDTQSATYDEANHES